MMKKIFIIIAILTVFTTVPVGCTTAASLSSTSQPSKSLPPIPSSTTSPASSPSPSITIAQPLATTTTPTPTLQGSLQSGVPLTVTDPADSSTLTTDTITVTGQTTPGVTVSANDQTGVADANGNFNIPLSLQDGPNAIDVIATDDSGNQGEDLLMVNVNLSQAPSTSVSSTKAPASTLDSQGNLVLKVTAPTDGTTINVSTVTVIGQTAPGATVSANNQTAVADGNGNFSIPVNLNAGPNAIDVIATDSSGNQGETTIMVNAGS